MGTHDFITYGFIYGLVRDRGPLSIKGIAKILCDEYGISGEDFQLSVHCSVGGILSNLSQNNLIRYLPRREFPDYKIWTITGNGGDNVIEK
jgi:hypothetical protein